ncbi:MarR family transcriptional regulator [Brachybacterium ginsengisoli]|uniref:MarR family transcriptional regulator n=1 Tax=Brachybacterium ginsengisoli TaxID=1331682 RepID=A0A291GUC5_9MICO|nr:MarR family transcriptional regulator [Brachybacterium ginsengisoli]ATG53797.1 MarR family transcriptional regulator [Brachybacterium ginsengisoli]
MSNYWYREQRSTTASSVELLNELRRYRESNTRMRSRVRDDMGMGEKDLLALRLLLAADAEDRSVRQRDLAYQLGISAASASALVDRLVNDGFVLRTPHPSDRRSIAVVPTPRGHHEVRETLHSMHARMLAVAEAMTPEDRAVVTTFFRDLNHSLDEPHSSEEPLSARPAAQRRCGAAQEEEAT